MKLDFFKTDLWIIGGEAHVIPKDTVPKTLEGAFLHSHSGAQQKVSFHYDRDKFAVERLTGDEPGREIFSWVHSKQTGKGVVDVTLRDDTFVVQLFKGAHGKVFPFTKEEFLNALYASKLNVELDHLELSGHSDDESDVDEKKLPSS